MNLVWRIAIFYVQICDKAIELRGQVDFVPDSARIIVVSTRQSDAAGNIASSDSGESSTGNIFNNTQAVFSVSAGSATPDYSVLLYACTNLIGSGTVASHGGFLVSRCSLLVIGFMQCRID